MRLNIEQYSRITRQQEVQRRLEAKSDGLKWEICTKNWPIWPYQPFIYDNSNFKGYISGTST